MLSIKEVGGGGIHLSAMTEISNNISVYCVRTLIFLKPISLVRRGWALWVSVFNKTSSRKGCGISIDLWPKLVSRFWPRRCLKRGRPVNVTAAWEFKPNFYMPDVTSESGSSQPFKTCIHTRQLRFFPERFSSKSRTPIKPFYLELYCTEFSGTENEDTLIIKLFNYLSDCSAIKLMYRKTICMLIDFLSLKNRRL